MKAYFLDTLHHELFYNLPAAQDVCPSGWHLPYESDFDALINSVGGNSSDVYKNLIEGGPSGFQAKLVGYVSVGINSGFPFFLGNNTRTIFWFSRNDPGKPKFNPPYLMFALKKVKKLKGYIEFGGSVRCIKN